MEPVSTSVTKKYDAVTGMYVLETKQFYSSPPWDVKKPKMAIYTLPFTVTISGYADEEEIDPDSFYLFGDEEEDDKKEKMKIKKKVDAWEAVKRRKMVSTEQELLDVEGTWKAQWLKYLMEDVKEDIVWEGEGETLDIPIPLENIKIVFTSKNPDELTMSGTLTWTSAAVPVKMMQDAIDWRLGDRMRYYGFEDDTKTTAEFEPGMVSLE